MAQWRLSHPLPVALRATVCATFALLTVPASVAFAQTPILAPPTTLGSWSTFIDDSATATVAAATPAPIAVSELFFPTNNLASWGLGYSFPDQTKTSIDGDALRVDVGKVDADRTAWKTYVYQKDLILKEGQAYVLKLRVKADAARQIWVGVQNLGGDWHDVGLAQQIDVSTTWQTLTFPFTAQNLTELGEQFVIQMGEQTGAVWLADVSLAPASGSVTLQGPASALQVTMAKPGDHVWSIQLNTNPFNLVNGHNYVLSYYVKSDVPRRIASVVRISSDDYHDVGGSDYSEVVGPSWRFDRIPFTAKNVKQDNVVVGFNLGAAGTGNVTIGDVKLVEAPAN
ncbi:MAG: carbohydrate binding domain-containing protein [Capsulimonadaceae bacterium]|nr:carbohydrate binding domain-containing protein [Capsulimonadaceae bacterium]